MGGPIILGSWGPPGLGPMEDMLGGCPGPAGMGPWCPIVILGSIPTPGMGIPNRALGPPGGMAPGGKGYCPGGPMGSLVLGSMPPG